MLTTVHSVQRDGEWVQNELVRLWSEMRQFESVFEKTFAPRCSSGPFALEFHLSVHLVNDVKRFGGLSVMNARPLEHSSALTKKLYRMTSR